MGKVERGVVRGSNKEGPGGDLRNNGFLGLAGGASTVHPANRSGPGAATAATARSRSACGASPINPPNNRRFEVGDVEMPQPESAIEPGRGADPVNPFLGSGAAAKAMPVSDMAKGK